MAEMPSKATPVINTTRALKRSTTKPAIACPTPDTAKNTVINKPSSPYDKLNSGFSHGIRAASIKW